MIKNPFLRKLHDLKYAYGSEASDYFKNNPRCQRCPEERIAALTVHHTKGKNVNEFETLCFNCHMIHHSRHKNFTHEDHLKFIENKAKKPLVRKERYEKITARWKELKSARLTGEEFGISHTAVIYALKKCGIVAT
jgi:hypothetical protein